MKRYNIRVYGICIKDGRLLVTDEIRFGQKMTKLIGGGLEFGEGLAAALKREWMEELNLPISVGTILYVNPFLQISAFDPNDEVLCHYFWVEPLAPLPVKTKTQQFDFEEEVEDAQIFRWVPLSKLSPATFTFPIDQALVPILLQAIQSPNP